MKTLLSFVFAALAAVVPTFAEPDLIFISAQGKPVKLGATDQVRVIQKIETIVSSASSNSRNQAQMFAKIDQSYWRPLKEMQEGSYIVVRYENPQQFKTIGGVIQATEIWLDLPDKARGVGRVVYPGPVTLVQGDQKIALMMVSGALVVELGRDKVVYPYLPHMIRETVAPHPVHEESKKLK